MAKQTYSDNVDANGKVFETVGDNIRMGARAGELIDFSTITDKLDALEPEISALQAVVTENEKGIKQNSDDISSLNEDLLLQLNTLSNFVNADEMGLPTNWVDGNIDDDGAIHHYNNRFSTEQYMKFSTPVAIGLKRTIVLMTYSETLEPLTRKVIKSAFIVPKNTIFRITVVDSPSKKDSAYSVFIIPFNSFKNTLKGDNRALNKQNITQQIDLNDLVESKIYEFDVAFYSDLILHAPTYPFKGTLVVLSPCGSKEVYTGDDTVFYGVGTVQILFPSRTHDTKQPFYCRYYISGGENSKVWSEWDTFLPYVKTIDYSEMNMIQCFENFGVIGDSISAGFTNIGGVNINSQTAVERGANWVKYMSLDISRDLKNYAIGGSTTSDWRNTNKASIEKKQCYILYLGGNDMSQNYPLGEKTDIKSDYISNLLTYYGNYDYIVRFIHNLAPKAHIFCISNTKYDHEKFSTYNRACEYVASLYEYCSYIDINGYVNEFTDFFNANFNGHFSPIGYNQYGKCIQNSLNEYMYKNPASFLGFPYITD